MTLSERFREALLYADELHRAQKRKGGNDIPYISHPLAVASIVMEQGGDEDETIAALLHDGIEDEEGHPSRRRFADGLGRAWLTSSGGALTQMKRRSHRFGRARKPT
jgi:hypothetical protein